MSLLADLLKLGDHALPSELPSQAQTERVIGSIVKVLEHEGLSVADELFPKASDTVAGVAAAADPSITAEATAKLEDLVDRIERAAAKVSGHQIAEDTPPAPAETPTPTPTPAPPGGFFGGPQTSPLPSSSSSQGDEDPTS
jgi:hypothetical protein